MTEKEKAMIKVGNNIRLYREAKGMSLEELAYKCGYTTENARSSMSKIERGKNDLPASKLKLIANALEINPAALLDDQPAVKQSPSHGTVINVLGHVAAGIPIEAITDIVDTEEISEQLARCGEYFGLRIKGDSMEPGIKNGDTIIVRQQPDAESGEVVVAIVNGNDGVCKRLRKYGHTLVLESDNHAYEPMSYDPQEVEDIPVRIAGKVVELRRKL